MIVEYHRPQTIEEALGLLARQEILTLPMGGGTVLNRPTPDPFAVVDLQSLGMDQIELRGALLYIGARVTLQNLLAHDQTPATLARAISLESAYNLRQVKTAAGTCVSADGRSSFATLLVAMDAQLELLPGVTNISLGDLYPIRKEQLRSKLISTVIIQANLQCAYEYVARTPADLPIVSVAVARWPSGRTRIVVGGFGENPHLVLDGTGDDGAETAVRQATAGSADQWASAEYRQQVSSVLVRRCLERTLVAGEARSA